MAATYIGGTTWAGFDDQTFTLPVCTQDDVAIVGATYNPGTGVPTLPAGWTLLRTHTFSSTMETRYWTRTLTNSDSGALITITYSGNVKNSGAVVVYRDVLLPEIDENTANSATLPNVTTDRDTIRIIGITERGGTPSTDYTPPAGFTERVEVHQTGGGSTGFGWADKLTEEAAGTHGGESWTNDGAPGGMATFSIALEPAAVTPPPTLLFNWNVRDVEYAAHRGGDPGPEETDHAFTTSWGNSSSAAEGDMQINADGTVVLMHDDTIDRTASASSPTTTGNVSSMTDAQWAAHLCKPNSGLTAPDSPPSTLASLAALHGPDGSLGNRLMVMENKVGTDSVVTVAAIKALGLEDRLIFNGYTYSDVTYARSQGLAAMYQASSAEVSAGLNFAAIKADGIDWLACDKADVDASFCTDAHAAGLDVWVYLVNTTTERDTYLGYGVDGFFTNKPQTLDPGTTIKPPVTLYAGAETVALSSTYQVTLTAGMPAGARVWYSAAHEAGDSSPTVPTLNVTDSKGNSWTTDQPALRNYSGGAHTGGTCIIYMASTVLDTALEVGDTITVTNPAGDWASTEQCVYVFGAEGAAGALDQTAVRADSTYTATPTTPSVTTTTSPQIAIQLWCTGPRGFTPNAGWTELTEQASSGGAARQLSVAYQIVEPSSSVQAAPTFSSASTSIGALLTYQGDSASTLIGPILFDGGALDASVTTVTEPDFTAQSGVATYGAGPAGTQGVRFDPTSFSQLYIDNLPGSHTEYRIGWKYTFTSSSALDSSNYFMVCLRSGTTISADVSLRDVSGSREVAYRDNFSTIGQTSGIPMSPGDTWRFEWHVVDGASTVSVWFYHEATTGNTPDAQWTDAAFSGSAPDNLFIGPDTSTDVDGVLSDFWITTGNSLYEGSPVLYPEDDWIADETYPKVVAHRFGFEEFPEETETALNALASYDCWAEADLRSNADGSGVLLHDTTVDRVAGSGETGNVWDYTDAQWSSLTIAWPDPPGGTPVPAAFLSGVLATALANRQILELETKAQSSVDILLAAAAADPVIRGRVVATSFNKSFVQQVATDGFRVAQIYSTGTTPDLDEDVANGAWAVNLDRTHSALTGSFVDDCHARGLIVMAYGATTQQHFDTLHGLGATGVDVVSTDYPTQFASANSPVIYNNTFEGIANNTTVTPANSGGASGDAFDVVSGDVKAQTAAAFIGSRGVTATLNSSTESYAGWNVSGSDHYVRTYFKVPSGGATHNMRLIYGQTGGTKEWEVRLNIPSQHIDLLTNDTQRINLDGAGSLVNGTWYRIEARIHSGGAELRLYSATNTLLDSDTWTGTPTVGTQIRYGLHNGSTISSAVDEDGFGYSDTDWLGYYPASGTPSASASQASAAIVDATSSTASGGGNLSYAIAQDSGAATSAELISTGKWAIQRHNSETLVYTITVTESGSGLDDTVQVSVTPQTTVNTIKVRNQANDGWV